MSNPRNHRVFAMSFAVVYPLYLAKITKKGRTKAELDAVICWLTGLDPLELAHHLAAGTTFTDLFAQARLHPDAARITGAVCGIRVEDVEDPLMRKIRYLDKVVDELARGWALERVLRQC
jgi:hypothetical protein